MERQQTRLDGFLQRWAELLVRRSGWVIAVTLVITLLLFAPSLNLAVIWGEDALFPSGDSDLIDRSDLSDGLGPNSVMVVVIEGATPTARRDFADRFAARLSAENDRYLSSHNDSLLRYMIYKFPLSFFESRRLLYVTEADLLDVEARLQHRLEQEKLKHNPFYIDLERLQEPEVDVTFQDLQAKYAVHRFRHYNTDAEDSLLLVFIKPQRPAVELEFSRPMVTTVRQILTELRERREFTAIRTQLGGGYMEQLATWRTLGRNAGVAYGFFWVAYSLLVLLLLRRLRILLILMLGLLGIRIWIRAIAHFVLGPITLFSSLSLGIILGFGAGFALLLVYHYMSARGRNFDVDDAIKQALVKTGRNLLASGLITCCVVAGLLLIDVADVRDFAWLLIIGLLSMLVYALVFVPALLVVWEHAYLMVVSAVVQLMKPLPRRLPRRRAIIALGLILTLLGMGVVWQSSTCWLNPPPKGDLCLDADSCCEALITLDDDYGRMAERDAERRAVRDKLQRVAPIAHQPIFFIAPDSQTLSRFTERLEKAAQHADSSIHSTYSMRTFVPANQADKREILDRIDKLATDENLRTFSRDIRRRIESERAAFHPPPITAYQLPLNILRGFSLQPRGSEALLELVAQALARLPENADSAQRGAAISERVDRLDAAQLEQVLLRAAAGGFNGLTKHAVTRMAIDERRATLARLVTVMADHFIGMVGAIYPRDNLLRGTAAMHFVAELEPILADFPEVRLVGKAADLGRTLRAIRAGGPIVALWGLLALVFGILLVFKRPLLALVLLLPPIVTISWLALGMALVGVAWNLYGVLAMFIVIGISLDLGIRVYLAYWDADTIGAVPSLMLSLPAVLLMAGTVFLSLFGWLFAAHASVVSMAAVGVVGVVLALPVVLGVFPAILEQIHLWKKGW